MKIGWKIRKLWHFEVSQIFTKHFLTSRYEYANERVDDVIASLLAIYFVHKILKNSIFCAYCIGVNIILHIFRKELRQVYHSHSWNMNFCHFCAQNEWEIVRRWHHQLAHLHIHTNWSRNVSWKFAKLQSVITFLFFNRFSSGFHCFIHKFVLFFMKLS